MTQIDLTTASLRDLAHEIERVAGFLMQRDGCDAAIAIDRASRLVMQGRALAEHAKDVCDEHTPKIS